MNSTQLAELCLAGCTEPQQAAIRHIDGPLLVLAGPGSGKTRVITRRIGYLVASGISPANILAITFTNKAAGEMRERVGALGVTPGAWLSTFHAFCARMLRIYAGAVGLNNAFTIYDTSDSIAAIKRAMQELEIDPSMFQPAAMSRAISANKNQLRAPGEAQVDDDPIKTATVAKIYARYDLLLRAANAVDFDDLLLLMVKLLQDESEAATRLMGRFQYVLVDEYQDTNRAQYLIAKRMAALSRNLCVTGDPDQSIYGWRGANIQNILEFEKDYSDAKVVRLEQNYRSTKRILQAADSVIANNRQRKIKALWTENAEGEPVRVMRLDDERAEADTIATDIARRVKNDEIVPKDVAIFYRTNAQSRVIETALHREALPYTIVAGTEFFQRKEIKDLICYLRLLDNPGDDVAVARIANVPARHLGNTSLDKMKEWGSQRGMRLMETFARAQEAGVRGAALTGIADFLGVLAQLRAMPRQPVAKLVERLIALTNYEKHLAANTDNAIERIENARELINAAAEYDQAEPEGNLQGFLEQVALISDTDRWDAARGGVTLMTLHAAKGLEFPAVYITGLEEGLLPLLRNSGDHDLEEERRLFFVGLTRARKYVVVTWTTARSRYGKQEFNQPSRFLAELPEGVERLDAEEPPPQEDYRPRPSLFPKPRAFNPPRAFAPPRGGATPPPYQPRRVKRDDNEEIVYDEDPGGGDFHAQPAPAPFKQGDAVVHPTYGRGRVMSLSGHGDDMRAMVRFTIVGVKTLVLKYARMRKE